jgi:predicted transcriptional regulator
MAKWCVIVKEIADMPINLPPELETRVTALAAAMHREPETVLAELVGTALEEDADFRSEVRAGIAELDAGKSVPHDEAMARLSATIERHGARQQ